MCSVPFFCVSSLSRARAGKIVALDIVDLLDPLHLRDPVDPVDPLDPLGSLALVELLALLELLVPTAGGGGPTISTGSSGSSGSSSNLIFGPKSSKSLVFDLGRPSPKEIFNKSGRPVRCAQPLEGGSPPPSH